MVEATPVKSVRCILAFIIKPVVVSVGMPGGVTVVLESYAVARVVTAGDADTGTKHSAASAATIARVPRSLITIVFFTFDVPPFNFLFLLVSQKIGLSFTVNIPHICYKLLRLQN